MEKKRPTAKPKCGEKKQKQKSGARGPRRAERKQWDKKQSDTCHQSSNTFQMPPESNNKTPPKRQAPTTYTRSLFSSSLLLRPLLAPCPHTPGLLRQIHHMHLSTMLISMIPSSKRLIAFPITPGHELRFRAVVARLLIFRPVGLHVPAAVVVVVERALAFSVPETYERAERGALICCGGGRRGRGGD